MPKLRISIDPTNPGEFYACCGLLELIELSGKAALSWFELEAAQPRLARFVIDGPAELNESWALTELKNARYEFRPHGDDKLCPVAVDFGWAQVELDWWLDEFREKASKLKTWAGRIGPHDFFSRLPPTLGLSASHQTMCSPVIGLDPRSAWMSLDVGYSPNDQAQDAAGYPGVEILGAIGLQGFRPRPAADRYDLTYCLWLSPLPVMLGRAAPWEGLQHREYVFRLGKRGSYKFFTYGVQRRRREIV